MIAFNRVNYSKYSRPINILMDLMIISILGFYLFKYHISNVSYYIVYLIIGWCVVAILINFYNVYRFTAPLEIVSKIIKQGLLFIFIIIAFFPFLNQYIFSKKTVAIFTISSMVLVSISKFVLFYFFKKHKVITKDGSRNIVIIGYSPEAIRLKKLFESSNDYGYHFFGYFSDKQENIEIKGKLKKLKAFVLENEIDEIYCFLEEVSNAQLNRIIAFSDEYKKTIKFIPDSKEIFSKKLQIDCYDSFPVLSLKKTALNDPTIKIFKRLFDIVFSVIVIIGLLSWLTPILAILIKLDSKGSLFFIQKRNGLNSFEFNCYKYRSMEVNRQTDLIQVAKNNNQITKMGKFMRKTSIDELPQFFNVLNGDMSVVGPRPHMVSVTEMYALKIDKFMMRHFIKPGITGLAQTKGLRGEIETERDMVNRIKFDVFYIENWTLILDIKIIYQTIVNIYKGEDKAC
jgi:putative colanic acid biosynthesis UDP-glucose lipid carrier transferase